MKMPPQVDDHDILDNINDHSFEHGTYILLISYTFIKSIKDTI